MGLEWILLYLRSTKRICQQHNVALKGVNDIVLKALALSEVVIPDDVVHDEGVTNTELNLDDED